MRKFIVALMAGLGLIGAVIFGAPILLIAAAGQMFNSGSISAHGVIIDMDSIPAGPIAGFSGEQLINAAHIMNAGGQLGLSTRDQTIGVTAAIGESSLQVLDHGDTAGPDSRGLFQQRGNGAWGTYEDRMNPHISATNFFQAMIDRVPDRATMAPTLVIHTVQGNKDPYHYEPFWTPASQIVQELIAVAGVEYQLPGGDEASGGWGGHSNGRIPAEALCSIAWAPGHLLRCDATHALSAMNSAYYARFGSNLSITDSYRSYERQVAGKNSDRGHLFAVPGTSNHGWGLALDLGGGINSFGSPQHQWMRANAGRFGWVHPAWAQAGGSKPEPWHWEYTG